MMVMVIDEIADVPEWKCKTCGNEAHFLCAECSEPICAACVALRVTLPDKEEKRYCKDCRKET